MTAIDAGQSDACVLGQTQLQRLLADKKNHALLRSLKVYFAGRQRHPSSAHRTICRIGFKCLFKLWFNRDVFSGSDG